MQRDLKSTIPDYQQSASAIEATPYVWRDPSALALRDWIAGHLILRGEVSVIIAPGGLGKTSLLIGTALSGASGNAFLGIELWTGAKRIWLWNLEDDRTELDRQIAAVALQHGITATGDIPG